MDLKAKNIPTLYKVPFDFFYTIFSERFCEKEIKQLIKRYNIDNMDILSIGTGSGHEEYWFGIDGRNRLTFFDIDQHGTIENILDNLSVIKKSDNWLEYYIGDFTKVENHILKKFDLLYISSFTPDELRRAYGAPIKFSINLLGFRVFNFIRIMEILYNPFHDSIYKAFSMVKPNGLVIIQSYAGDINPIRYKYYIKSIKNAFKNHNITLLDFFCFESYPSVQLMVAFVGDEHQAREFYKKVSSPLTSFHGRSQLKRKVISLYSLSN